MTSVHWHLPPIKTVRNLLAENRALKQERDVLTQERDLAIGALGEKVLEIAELRRCIDRLRGDRQ